MINKYKRERVRVMLRVVSCFSTVAKPRVKFVFKV